MKYMSDFKNFEISSEIKKPVILKEYRFFSAFTPI